MKKMNSSGLLLFAMIISTFSCTKNQSIAESKTVENDFGIASPRTFRLNTNDQNGRLPSSTQFVTLSASNQYISTYGGIGLTFGASLPHPTTPDPTGIHDGEAIGVGYVGLMDGTQIAGIISGSYFDVLIPTIAGNVPSGSPLANYKASLDHFWNKVWSVATYPPPPFMQTYPGVITKEVKGELIRDHFSPTKMSVCSDSWKGNFLELATILKSPYSIKVYGPSYTGGTANGVWVTQNGGDVSVTTFTLSYNTYTNTNGDWLHIGGTIKLANGTTLTINSDILLVA